MCRFNLIEIPMAWRVFGTFFVLIFSITPLSYADTVVLKSGEEYSGKIKKQSDHELVLEQSDGEAKTISRSEVEYFVLERHQLTFDNGDSLTGEILSEDNQKLTINTRHSGEVTVPKSSIAERKKVKVGYAGLPPDQRIDLPPESPWSGGVDLGYTAVRGNSENDNFYAQAQLKYKKGRIENRAYAKYNYARSEDQTTEDRAELGDQLNIDLGPMPYVYGSGELGFDRVRLIDFYGELGAGGGLHLLHDRSSDLNLEAGLTYRYEDRQDADDEHELFARVAEIYRVGITSRLDLEQKLELFPSLSDAGEYRGDASVTLKYQLQQNLNLKLLGEYIYDSDPPAGVDEEDIRFVTTLGYSF